MQNQRERVPNDHPLSSTFGATDVKRVRDDLDDVFEFSDTNLQREDVKVSAGRGSAKVEPSGHLPDDKFETFNEQAKQSDKLGWDPSTKTNFARSENLDTPAPFDVHASRDPENAALDAEREATVTTDPEKYASDPTRYDYPFVDTPQSFLDEFGGELNPYQKIEREAGEDEILKPHEW